MFRISLKFPSLAPARRVELVVVRIQPTSIIRSTQARRRSLQSLLMLMLVLQALIWTRTNTHVTTPDTLLVCGVYFLSYI